MPVIFTHFLQCSYYCQSTPAKSPRHFSHTTLPLFLGSLLGEGDASQLALHCRQWKLLLGGFSDPWLSVSPTLPFDNHLYLCLSRLCHDRPSFCKESSETFWSCGDLKSLTEKGRGKERKMQTSETSQPNVALVS
jgi:hypothetical protein